MREVAHGRSDGVNPMMRKFVTNPGVILVGALYLVSLAVLSRNKDLEFADAGIELVLFGVGGFIETWKIGR